MDCNCSICSFVSNGNYKGVFVLVGKGTIKFDSIYSCKIRRQLEDRLGLIITEACITLKPLVNIQNIIKFINVTKLSSQQVAVIYVGQIYLFT